MPATATAALSRSAEPKAPLEMTGEPLPPFAPLDDVKVTCDLSVCVAMLEPDLADGPGVGLLKSPYHRAPRLPAVGVTLRSLSEPHRSGHGARVRRIRLWLHCDRPGERISRGGAGWCRWRFARRIASDLAGGSALSAQDVLSPDGSALTLLLLPGEVRNVGLDIVARLDDLTRPGDYPFTIVAEDIASDGEDQGVRHADTVRVLLRLTHPSARLLDYLPALWREALEDEAAKNAVGGIRGPGRGTAPYVEPPFFARYLRGFDDVWLPLQDAIGQFSALFAIETAPEDFLPWLAGWIGLTIDERWPPMRRRQLIREAVELWRWRGTRRGLSRFLEIYTGVVPQISDQPSAGFRLGDGKRLAQADMRLGSTAPHTFQVTLAVPRPEDVNVDLVRGIIDAQKPAHTAYRLRVLTATDDAPGTVTVASAAFAVTVGPGAKP